ncbi:PREDICTED: dnaJ homolog subfamily A member 4 [Ipomoea nil]|uniref:dnaJ homolog subfamily A member 4 n=1 Tax=Ipomoea nil TaxID=35883 RepID=UPI0009015905|nr:PREDICTED: dnaJ homolog subfamily A member 4 [Ipomoea nil]
MGRSRNESADNTKKSQLVIDICNVSLRASSCAHRHHRFRPEKPGFVDWYLVLGIDESSGVDAIKKRYRGLALQLHPDKNKHPKAEVAFKLVSEAYVCLADDVRRGAFDLQRHSSFCNECCNNPYLNSNPPPQAKPRNVSQIVRELKARFSQEATVIEKCVKMNANARIRRCEYPIFNPSDYVSFHGYPHHRNQIVVGKKYQSAVFEHRTERAQKLA